MKLFFPPDHLKPTCSCLKILKPNLAADLWLSATTSLITLLTFECTVHVGERS